MSKFDGILSAKMGDRAKAKSKSVNETKSVEPAEPPPAKRVGKRSHPDFTQITAYIKKTTHEDVMRKIYKRQEFSELLEELLTNWLQRK